MTRRTLISASTPCLRACLFDTLTALLEEEMRRPVDVVLMPESRLREKNTRPISSVDRWGIITLQASLNQQRWN